MERQMSEQVSRFAIIGGGRRSEFFLRLAQDLPQKFVVTGLYSRSAEKRSEVASRFGVPVRDSIDALLADRPDFVLVAVPRTVVATVTIDLVERGARVLVETPPAVSVDEMRDLWSRVGATDLVQVADQSMYMPSHLAREQIARSGVIGTPTSVHVSSNHLYHAVSIMRVLLRAGKGGATVVARDFTAPLVDPLNFRGYTGDTEPGDKVTTLATIDFGNGRSGLYDFTENQWFNPLRQRRLVVRGSRGEIVDDTVVFMEDPQTVIESRLVRRQTGIDHNLEGFNLDNISFNGKSVFRNPFATASQSDEDIAVALLVYRMSAWTHGDAPAPYPLADGMQDHLLGLAIEQSAESGQPVTTMEEPWARAASPFED